MTVEETANGYPLPQVLINYDLWVKYKMLTLVMTNRNGEEEKRLQVETLIVFQKQA